MMGHNSLKEAEVMIASGANRITNAEDDTFDGWLEIGTALNIGKATFGEDDKGFGKWREPLLGQLAQVENKDLTAAMWGAANPDELANLCCTNLGQQQNATTYPPPCGVPPTQTNWRDTRQTTRHGLHRRNGRKLITGLKIHQLGAE